MAAMPIYGKKPLKIFSRNEDALWLNLCINHRGQEVYQSCLNSGRTLTFDLCKFASLCICMGKMLRISKDFSSGASGPVLLKFHVEPPWGRGMKDC